MKYLTTFAIVCASSALSAITLTPVTDETTYWTYQTLPGERGTLNGTSPGIGDTDDVPLKRVALVMSFATTDAWRAAAAQNDATIILRFEISSIRNGGAPTDIKLALLDVGRDFSGSFSSSGFAWLDAPTFHDYGNLVDPDAVDLVQAFDVTQKVREHIQNLDFKNSAICFALYTPIPSDNGIENTSSIRIATANLEVIADSVSSTDVEIKNAVLVKFDTTPGYSYFIEYSSDLSEWTREPKGIEGDGNMHKKFYPVSRDREFYRVVIIE